MNYPCFDDSDCSSFLRRRTLSEMFRREDELPGGWCGDPHAPRKPVRAMSLASVSLKRASLRPLTPGVERSERG